MYTVSARTARAVEWDNTLRISAELIEHTTYLIQGKVLRDHYILRKFR